MARPNSIRSCKELLATTGLLFCICAVHAQPTFIRTYALPPAAGVMGVAVTPNDGLVICGNISFAESYLLRLDRNGHTMWMKLYGALGNAGWGGALYPFDDNRFNAVSVAPNGRIIVAGATNGMGVGSDRSITCFDSLGTLLWGQTSGSATHSESLEFAACGSDNTVIVAGTNPDLAYERGAMYRFSVDTTHCLGGVQLFGALTTVPQALDYAVDGNFLLSTGYFGYQLIKLSPSFDPIWQRAWMDFSPIALFGEASGRTIAASDTVIVAIDPSGTLAWARRIDVIGGSLKDVAVRPDGNILALGTNGNAYSWLLQLDSSGEPQWMWRYGNDGDAIVLSRLELLSNGSALLVGRAANNTLCVVSVDQNGELANCSFPAVSADVTPLLLTPIATVALENITIETYPGQLDEIDSAVYILDQINCSMDALAPEEMIVAPLSIVPNPMSNGARLILGETLTINARIDLMDPSGRVLRTINSDGKRTVSIERGDLSSGLYLLRIVDGQRTVAAKRLVID